MSLLRRDRWVIGYFERLKLIGLKRLIEECDRVAVKLAIGALRDHFVDQLHFPLVLLHPIGDSKPHLIALTRFGGGEDLYTVEIHACLHAARSIGRLRVCQRKNSAGTETPLEIPRILALAHYTLDSSRGLPSAMRHNNKHRQIGALGRPTAIAAETETSASLTELQLARLQQPASRSSCVERL